MKIKLRWGTIILAVLSIVLLLLGSYYYISNIRQSIWMQLATEVLEVTTQGGHAFETHIEKENELLTSFSRGLSQNASVDEEAILEELNHYTQSGEDYVVIDLDHQVSYSNKSVQKRKLSKEELEAYRKLSESGMREPYLSIDTGDILLGCYQRFSFQDGAKGIVQREHLASDMSEEFSLSFYDNTGFSYIVNKEGDIMIRSNHKNSNHTFTNIFDIIDKNGNRNEKVEIFDSGESDREKGVMRVDFENQDNIFAFVPVNNTDEWYLISIIPNSVVMKYTDRILDNSESLVLLVGSAVFVCILFVFIFYCYRKNEKEKDAEVQCREQLFSRLVRNTDDVFLIFSGEDFKVEYVSPNVKKVLGIAQKEVKEDITSLGKPLYTNDEKVDYDTLKKVPVGGSVTYEAQRIHKKTGEQKWYLETIYRAMIENSDKYIVLFSDRTEYRRSEYALKEALDNAKAANASKSIFLSNMSHDIRTPMNAIVGLTTLLQRDADNPELVRKHTKKITASSQHLLGLINDVLDMSKIESGKITLNITEINLAEIVEELEIIMRPQIKAKQQEFELSVVDVQTENLLGDKLRINQILINILSNAVKYTPVGGRIEMEISQLPQDSNNYTHLRFVVRDNGIGMSEDYVKTIFQPFTREIRSTTNQVQGTGLGMAITKNLVDLMGGTIEVESKKGEGSAFTVDLELRIQKQNVDKKFWKEYGIRNILIIDDEVDICSGIITAMAGTGVSMQFALDGYTAVQMVESAREDKNDFDLILIDWKMPGMDGIATARRIREMISSDIPIMILSAYDWGEIEEEGMAAGINGFLQKPFFLSNFMRTIKNLKDEESSEAVTGEQGKVFEGKKILAAEDNELNAEILTEIMGMMGASCKVAEDGEKVVEAFEKSQPGEFDMILMDVQMPNMNGYEATRAIRAGSHPQGKSIPIIAMTANAFADDIKDAMDSGMDAHVAKPIDVDRLGAVVSRVLAEKEER